MRILLNRMRYKYLSRLVVATLSVVRSFFLGGWRQPPSLLKTAMSKQTGTNQDLFDSYISSLGLNSQVHFLNTSKSRIKAYCISDLHADSKCNFQWTLENCVRKEEDTDVFTILILPGDVGTEVDRLDSIFTALVRQYDAVCYVPGNHEVWRRGTATGGSAVDIEVGSVRGNREARDSLAKYKEVMLLAEKRTVHTTPLRVSNSATTASRDDKGRGVWVIPIQSWYHASWDTEPVLTNPDYTRAQQVIPFSKMWSDFSMCSWPSDLLSHEEFASVDGDNDVLARFFDSMNDRYLPNIRVTADDTVLSFSHFLPRQELCPEKRFLLEPLLSRVIGSTYLESRIRTLRPHVHMFGHTHIPIDMRLDGLRYLQWSLGTHKESTRQCAIVYHTGPLLVYDSAVNGVPAELASEQTHWTQYYRQYRRDPSVTDVIAPWVQRRLDSYRGLIESSLKSRGEQT